MSSFVHCQQKNAFLILDPIHRLCLHTSTSF